MRKENILYFQQPLSMRLEHIFGKERLLFQTGKHLSNTGSISYFQRPLSMCLERISGKERFLFQTCKYLSYKGGISYFQQLLSMYPEHIFGKERLLAQTGKCLSNMTDIGLRIRTPAQSKTSQAHSICSSISM